MLLLTVQAQLEAAELPGCKTAAAPQVCGVGALTSQVLEREILDWGRFKNRRQVASLTGMCPGVHLSSGSKIRNGPITRHGNRRIRTALVELACKRCLRPDPTIGQCKNGGRCWPRLSPVAGPRRRRSWRWAGDWPSTCWRMNTEQNHAREARTEIKLMN